MLPIEIVNEWIVLSGIEDAVGTSEPREIQELQEFLIQLSQSSPEQAREILAESDNGRNRRLAWWLLYSALRLGGEVLTAKSYLEWAEFVGQYGDPVRYRADALEGHCHFYMGVLCHLIGDLTEAQKCYANAEHSYRFARAPLALQALAAYSEGAAALESDNVDGIENPDGGARNLFSKAVRTLEQETSDSLKELLQDSIERSLRQWDLINQLLEDDPPEPFLEVEAELADRQLIRMLEGRMRRQAYEGEPVSEVLRLARLIEAAGAHIGEETSPRHELVAYYHSAKRLDYMEAVLRELIDMQPDDLDLRKALAGALAAQGKFQQMRNVLDHVLKENQGDADLHGLLSCALHALGDLEEAVREARVALSLDPEQYAAALTLKALEKKQPESPKARATVSFHDGVMEVSPEFSSLSAEEGAALMSAAMLAASPERIPEALEEMATSDPEFARMVTVILQDNGLFTSNREDDPELHFQKAEEFFGNGAWQEAILEYQKAIELDENLGKAYMGIGDVHFRKGEHYTAIAYFEEALEIQPDPFTYRFLGDSYRSIGKPREAEEAYRQALSLKPDYAGANQALELVLAEGADRNEEFERKVAADNVTAMLYNHASRQDAPLDQAGPEPLRGQGKGARQGVPPERVAVLQRVGEAAAAAGDTEVALRSFHEALDLALNDPNNRVTPANLIRSCQRIGDLLRDLRLYKTALRYHQTAVELEETASQQ